MVSVIRAVRSPNLFCTKRAATVNAMNATPLTKIAKDHSIESSLMKNSSLSMSSSSPAAAAAEAAAKNSRITEACTREVGAVSSVFAGLEDVDIALLRLDAAIGQRSLALTTTYSTNL